MAHRLDLVRRDDSGQELLASFLVARRAGSEAAVRVASDVAGLAADPMAAARSACPPVLGPWSNLLAQSVRLLPVVAPLVQRARQLDATLDAMEWPLAQRAAQVSQLALELLDEQALALVVSERLPDPPPLASRPPVVVLRELAEPYQAGAELSQGVRQPVEQPQREALAVLRPPAYLERRRDEPSKAPASELELRQPAAPVFSLRRTSPLPPPLPGPRDRGNASAPTRLYRDRASSSASSFR